MSKPYSEWKHNMWFTAYLFDFFVENVLDDFAETLELRLELLTALLLIFILRKLKAFLRHRHQGLAVIFFQLAMAKEEK